MRGSMLRSRWAAIGAAVAVAVGAGGASWIANAESSPPSSFVPITPCRLMDTRGPANIGPRASEVGPGEIYTPLVWGTNGNCTIPPTAAAVSLNVTFVSPTEGGYLSVFPADKPWPGTSNLNWNAGQAATPNAVTSQLSSDGRLAFYNFAGKVHLIADIVGYYESALAGPPGPKGDAGASGADGVGGLDYQATTEVPIQWGGSPTTVVTLTVEAPVAGFIAVSASAIFMTGSVGFRCEVLLNDSPMLGNTGNVASGTNVNFSAVRGFAVPAGSTAVSLACIAIGTGGGAPPPVVAHAAITVVFSAERI